MVAGNRVVGSGLQQHGRRGWNKVCLTLRIDVNRHLCDEGKSSDFAILRRRKTRSFCEGIDLKEDMTALKLLSNDYIIATIIDNIHVYFVKQSALKLELELDNE